MCSAQIGAELLCWFRAILFLLCRRLFNWFSFLLFFYNGFAGFVNAILRTLLASLFTILLLFRLDRVVLMRGFERFDFGEWTVYPLFYYTTFILKVLELAL